MKWQDIRWKAIEKYVFNMQKKIYQASLNDKNMEVMRLQKILVRSKAAKLKAIRKVTQDNIGKKTPGVDGIKSIPPEQRLNLLTDLRLDGNAAPIKRVYIPKGKNEKRPLGIPIIQDRIKQALVKLVLEPEWEAKFEPNSYGFRPGRSCHDAVEAIFIAINQKPKYVLDADIKGCFDNIDHQFLLTKLNTFPEMEMQIKSWLKAGVMKDISLTIKKRSSSGRNDISAAYEYCSTRIRNRNNRFYAELKTY